MVDITIGVLALQGAFDEHIQLLTRASNLLHEKESYRSITWHFLEVRTASQLESCTGLIIPGGESTTISRVAARSGILEPLRTFVRVQRRPTWGTCAGLILLAESANRTEAGGQELIGGLDVQVTRNYFGRQTESFEADLRLEFLRGQSVESQAPFHSLFIRAPVVDKILTGDGKESQEIKAVNTVSAPAPAPADGEDSAPRMQVEILGRLPPDAKSVRDTSITARDVGDDGDIIAVKQGNVFGTSFHPELTGDCRIHVWWLEQVIKSMDDR